MIDWLMDFIDCLIAWFIDWLIDSSMGNPDTGRKTPKLKVLKTIDFKDFLENKSSKNSVFTMKQNSLTSIV